MKQFILLAIYTAIIAVSPVFEFKLESIIIAMTRNAMKLTM